ncbi:MAG: hypothetical protein AAGU03_00970 [Anaerolineaceae bacterium]|jgi:hypothetical protein
MKLVFSKFFVIVILIAFLSISSASPTGAQPPDPPEVLENGEFPVDANQVQPILTERTESTVNAEGNGITAVATWWSASGTTFVPASSSITYNYGSAGCVDTGTIADVWRGSVNLAQGSKITGMYFNFANDIAAPGNTTIYLRRYSYAGGYQDILSVTGTTDGTGNHFLWTSTVANNVVDNFTYAYVLVWVGNADQNLCGVNLQYEAPPIFVSALPMINK